MSATFEQVRLRMAAHTTGEAWALVPRGEKPLFLPEPFPGNASVADCRDAESGPVEGPTSLGAEEVPFTFCFSCK
ncbi:MAG: hypothetical protein AUH11_03795 [Acidobacteria bacterium 13_2_20CM_57_17]|nr:MAG: hypothetical protein AUH11_03795 [Acidobacteria bacterium 13_2_20CM_57_17]OLB94547.1 MAG: hypothetical protein AUI02_04990 [Acidobacteria bacterium 13_2_20CM_2_57_12]